MGILLSTGIAHLTRQLWLLVAVGFIFGQFGDAAFADDRLPPEQVMARFLNSFVAYDYETCRSLLAPEATISIVRRDGEPSYEHSIQPAADWLAQVAASGVKYLDSFSVDIHDVVSLKHDHGATVMLKFSATGHVGSYSFQSSGFDTGNLIETPDGWRILHYSSFEDFKIQTILRESASTSHEH